MSDFRLLMVSAMYENGGNVTHRLLDGHPQMHVYPFESQLGTRWVQDHLTSLFPVKYRWPVFPLEATSEEDYDAIIDEETKIRARTPHVSKFRHVPFDFSDAERQQKCVRDVRQNGRSRANNVAAFFRATFDAWKNCQRTGEEAAYVGYSPILVVDADKILEDFPQAHVLHVVRNPWAAYADTKKRPVPLSLPRYVTAWVTVQHHALVFQRAYPDRLHVLRYEDIIADPETVLGRVCEAMRLRREGTLRQPTWNGHPLDEVSPWGTIRHATLATNQATADELSADETSRLRMWAQPYLDIFGYHREEAHDGA